MVVIPLGMEPLPLCVTRPDCVSHFVDHLRMVFVTCSARCSAQTALSRCGRFAVQVVTRCGWLVFVSCFGLSQGDSLNRISELARLEALGRQALVVVGAAVWSTSARRGTSVHLYAVLATSQMTTVSLTLALSSGALK